MSCCGHCPRPPMMLRRRSKGDHDDSDRQDLCGDTEHRHARSDGGSQARSNDMINLSPPPRHLDASFDELLQSVHDRGLLLTEAAGSEGNHKLISYAVFCLKKKNTR